MTKLLTVLLLAGLSFASCKKDDSGSNNNNNNNNNSNCAAGATVCFKIGDTTVSMPAKWVELVGSASSIQFEDATQELDFDLGTRLEKRKYTITSGSLSSGYARISYRNKTTNVSYKATAGEVEITNVDNATLTGKFNATFRNESNQATVAVTAGTLSAVPKQ